MKTSFYESCVRQSMLNLLILLVLFPCLSFAANCPRGSEVNDRHGINGLALYSFSSQVIQAFEMRDMQRIASFIDGELKTGPRKERILKSRFSDVFTEEFRSAVISAGPVCEWFNDQGTMIGAGLIWIQGSGDTFSISTINDWKADPLLSKNIPTGWKVDDKYLTPDCFVYEWNSGDNFEAFEDYLGISEGTLSAHLNVYISKVPYSISSPWGEGVVRLVVPVKDAGQEYLPPKVSDGSWLAENDPSRTLLFEHIDGSWVTLRILSEVPTTIAQRVSGFKGKCLESYVIRIQEIARYGDRVYGLYGLFLDDNDVKVIVPIKYFESEAEALTFVKRTVE